MVFRPTCLAYVTNPKCFQRLSDGHETRRSFGRLTPIKYEWNMAGYLKHQYDILVFCLLISITSSSAVAERPRDALCLSVFSLNKIITPAESFIIVT